MVTGLTCPQTLGEFVEAPILTSAVCYQQTRYLLDSVTPREIMPQTSGKASKMTIEIATQKVVAFTINLRSQRCLGIRSRTRRKPQ